ncbi:methylglyoxal synthase, partial [Burkholderia gladioli]|nr:methylglyoxal synthase [Burkholderia gladioli]
MEAPRIALIAHDAKKNEIVALTGAYRDTLAQCT